MYIIGYLLMAIAKVLDLVLLLFMWIVLLSVLYIMLQNLFYIAFAHSYPLVLEVLTSLQLLPYLE